MNQGLYLTLRFGSVTHTPAPAAVMEALSDVEVSSSASGQSGFKLNFRLGKDSELQRELLPSGFFAPKRRVIIVATVRGTPHVLMDGVITRQDVAPSERAGESTLAVTGLDLTALMDVLDFSGIPYPAMPASARIAIILAKYAPFGVVPLVAPSVVQAVEIVQNPARMIATHQGTDLAYITQLATQYGHVFYLSPGPKPGMSVAYWGPEARFGLPQPALTVNSGAASNVESLSFAYDGLARTQYLATVLEKRSRIPIPIPVPDITPLKPPLALERAALGKTESLGCVGHLEPAEAVRVMFASNAAGDDAVTATGELDPLRYGGVLQPRGIVPVRGGGVDYDGLYFVKNVTHRLKPGEYRQGFSLARGGLKPTFQRVSA